MSLTNLIAFGALAVSCLGPLFLLSFQLGRVAERVEALEQDGRGHGSLAIAFAEFKGEVRGILQGQTEKMEALRSDLTWLRQAAVYERPGGGA